MSAYWRGANVSSFTGDIFYLAPIYIYSKDSDIGEFISSFRKMVKAEYDWAMPGHNEAMVEKKVVEGVLTVIEAIKAGKRIFTSAV